MKALASSQFKENTESELIFYPYHSQSPLIHTEILVPLNSSCHNSAIP